MRPRRRLLLSTTRIGQRRTCAAALSAVNAASHSSFVRVGIALIKIYCSSPPSFWFIVALVPCPAAFLDPASWPSSSGLSFVAEPVTVYVSAADDNHLVIVAPILQRQM